MILDVFFFIMETSKQNIKMYLQSLIIFLPIY